jgi:hypothetical protein
MQDSHCRSNWTAFSASMRPATCKTTLVPTWVRSMVTIS